MSTLIVWMFFITTAALLLMIGSMSLLKYTSSVPTFLVEECRQDRKLYFWTAVVQYATYCVVLLCVLYYTTANGILVDINWYTFLTLCGTVALLYFRFQPWLVRHIRHKQWA